MPAGSRFAFAVHTLAVLGYLREQGVERLSSDVIAKSVNTNPVVIRNLLRSLKKAGLVISKEGRGGGVSLAVAPAKITLRQIYDAVETNAVLFENRNPEFKPCPVSRGMKRVLTSLSQDIDRVVAKTLQNKTLASVIDAMPEA